MSDLDLVPVEDLVAAIQRRSYAACLFFLLRAEENAAMALHGPILTVFGLATWGYDRVRARMLKECGGD